MLERAAFVTTSASHMFKVDIKKDEQSVLFFEPVLKDNLYLYPIRQDIIWSNQNPLGV